MRDLLIPTIGPNKLIPASPEATIVQSERDSSLRRFGCTYYLEDTRARTNFVALKVDEHSDFHIKTVNSDIDIFLEYNDSRMLSSVLIGCIATKMQEALSLSFPHMQRLASSWCFKYMRPVGIYSIKVYDINNEARWLLPNVYPKIIPPLKIPAVTLWDAPLTLLVAVFREGMNATVLSHKFLSYFKILEAYPNQGPFKDISNYCKSQSIQIPRSPKILSADLLHGALDVKYHSAFLDKKFTRIRDELIGYRNAIAHPFIGHNFLDVDTFEVQAKLAALSNMLERMAIEILDEEIRLLSKVSPDDVYKLIVESYTITQPK